MQCEVCQKKKATVHFKQVVDGESREMYICESCAAQKGFNVESPLCLTDFLFGMKTPPSADKPVAANEPSCPTCHMRSSDFKKTSRLGCPNCYRIFAEELAPMLEEMHKGCQHKGKVPKSATLDSREEELRLLLEQAVTAQNFEEAARLRDQLHELASSALSAKTRRS